MDTLTQEIKRYGEEEEEEAAVTSNRSWNSQEIAPRPGGGFLQPASLRGSGDSISRLSRWWRVIPGNGRSGWFDRSHRGGFHIKLGLYPLRDLLPFQRHLLFTEKKREKILWQAEGESREEVQGRCSHRCSHRGEGAAKRRWWISIWKRKEKNEGEIFIQLSIVIVEILSFSPYSFGAGGYCLLCEVDGCLFWG